MIAFKKLPCAQPTPGKPTYARLPKFFQGPADAADRLAALNILLCGAGSIGMRIIDDLIRLHPKALKIVDPKNLKAESVCTHPTLPTESGRAKAELLAERVAAISPETDVSFAVGKLQDLDIADLLDINVIVLASDNLQAELDAGILARRIGAVLIHASVAGEILVAQVRTFSPDSACPACLWGPEEFRRLNEGARFSCDGGPVAENETPTMSVASLCALAASHAVLQLLRDTLGLGPSVRSTVLTCPGTRPENTFIAPLVRRKDCPSEHRIWRRLRLQNPLAAMSHDDLIRAAGLEHDADRVTVRVHNPKLIEICGSEECALIEGEPA